MSQATPSSVTLFERRDGGPVRLRGNGRSARASGLYFSVKSGRHLPHTSHLQLHDLWRAEVEVDVVCSWPQPFTLTFAEGDRLRRYTPSRKDLRADGSVEIIEVRDDAAQPAPAREAAIIQALTLRGMSYRVACRTQIQAEPAFGAIRTVQRHRRTALEATEVLRIETALATGPLAIADTLRLLGSGPPAFAKVCAMMVRRIVRIDLTNGLRPEALVTTA